MRIAILLIAPLACAAALAGCTVLPAAGPTPTDIVTEGVQTQAPFYELFDLDDNVLHALTYDRGPSLAARFGTKAPRPVQAMKVGDVVVIQIFEAANGGLFTPPASSVGAGTRSVTLPPQTVDTDGKVSVPYAGRVQAAGRTPAQLGATINAALAGKAIEPQTIVTVQSTTSQTATVIGDAGGAARVPLGIKGDRLLEVVAQAGPLKNLPFETNVRVLRGARAETVSLLTVTAHPDENIYIYPGDTIYIYRDPQTFTMFGSFSGQRSYIIDQNRLTLSEAMGTAGGLLDSAADPAAIFLFRLERPEVVRLLRPASPLLDRSGARIPVIYRISLRDPRGIFYARAMRIHDKDIVYAANAPAVEFLKFVRLVSSVGIAARTIGSSGSVVVGGQ